MFKRALLPDMQALEHPQPPAVEVRVVVAMVVMVVRMLGDVERPRHPQLRRLPAGGRRCTVPLARTVALARAGALAVVQRGGDLLVERLGLRRVRLVPQLVPRARALSRAGTRGRRVFLLPLLLLLGSGARGGIAVLLGRGNGDVVVLAGVVWGRARGGRRGRARMGTRTRARLVVIVVVVGVDGRAAAPAAAARARAGRGRVEAVERARAGDRGAPAGAGVEVLAQAGEVVLRRGDVGGQPLGAGGGSGGWARGRAGRDGTYVVLEGLFGRWPLERVGVQERLDKVLGWNPSVSSALSIDEESLILPSSETLLQ